MTHEELLAMIKPMKNHDAIFMKDALLAVVELHTPGGYEYFEKDICEHCTLDIDLYVFYPCPTIEAIKKELS
jgi:hypothetical protein